MQHKTQAEHETPQVPPVTEQRAGAEVAQLCAPQLLRTSRGAGRVRCADRPPTISCVLQEYWLWTHAQHPVRCTMGPPWCLRACTMFDA